MTYLDNGATSFHKPQSVYRAVAEAMKTCANPGRGGHTAARKAAETVYNCRETAADFFGCQPQQVVFTANCTHGLNIAIRSLVKPGDRVVFQDTEGTVFEYQVAATEVVSPSALEEVTAGVHDLTLITCTYGGKTRLVVSCDAVTK